MVPYCRAAIVLSVMLAVAVRAIHPKFDLKDGIFHKRFDGSAQRVLAGFDGLDSPASSRAALTQETSSTQIASNFDSLDLNCVRIC